MQQHGRFTRIAVVSAAALVLASIGAARAADVPDATAHDMAMGADAHAHHHPASSGFARSVVSYQTPDVDLVRDDGRRVNLRAELDDGRAVVLAFIYTSCTTVCPMTSHTLSQVQEKLGADRDGVHLVSISIDPEQDTPARLRDYARTYHAGASWRHYTGTLAASQTAQRAFDVYRGDKMSHSPAILVRGKPGGEWVRLDGFATAEQVLAELPPPVLSANR
jgi:protein SCO1/2